MPPRSVDSVQSASVTAAAICALFCAAVGVDPGPAPVGPGTGRKVITYWLHIVFAWTASYPFLAMQADQACCALIRSGSLITSSPTSSFIVSMPAVDVASWALLNAPTMLRHFPPAAAAPAGMLVPGPGRPSNSSGPPVSGWLKPYCSASESPM